MDGDKNTLGDFFAFRKMVSLSLMKILYAIGVIFVTAIGIIAFISITAGGNGWGGYVGSPFHLLGRFLGGAVAGGCIILIGNLAWRVVCEWWAVLFSVHEVVVKIEENTREPRG